MTKIITKLDWAEREIELTKERVRETSAERLKDILSPTTIAYDAALAAFKVMYEVTKLSFYETKVARGVLDKLLDGEPLLLPIQDGPDEWIEAYPNQCNNSTVFQSARKSTLFKEVRFDGAAQYSDNSRFLYRSLEDGGVVDAEMFPHMFYPILNRLAPITMPYMPEKIIFYGKYKTFTIRDDFDNENIGTILNISALRNEKGWDLLPGEKYYKFLQGQAVEIEPYEFYKFYNAVLPNENRY